MRKSFLLIVATVAVALGMAKPAEAAVMFDPTGGGCAVTCYTIDLFDPTTGNALSVGLNANSPAGTVGELYYQANLGIASLNGIQQYSNGDDGAFFTFAASFEETVTASVGGTLLFGPTAGATNGVFNMFEQAGEGSNLAGTCFVDDCGGTLILSGTLLNDANFFGNFSANIPAGSQNLDQFNGDNYGGQQTVSGQGGFGATILITGVDPMYFPDLTVGSAFVFVTTQQRLPFLQADPSACFSSDASTSCDTLGVAGLGGVNGLNSDNTILQTDASLSIVQQNPIPEPATLTLLGLGLLGSATARRLRARKS